MKTLNTNTAALKRPLHITPALLSNVIAIHAHKHFVICNYIATNYEEKDFDWYKKTWEYFLSLDFPKELKKNRVTFETILNITPTHIEALMDMQEEELSNRSFWFPIDCFRDE